MASGGTGVSLSRSTGSMLNRPSRMGSPTGVHRFRHGVARHVAVHSAARRRNVLRRRRARACCP
jgi:hypothetical protein